MVSFWLSLHPNGVSDDFRVIKKGPRITQEKPVALFAVYDGHVGPKWRGFRSGNGFRGVIGLQYIYIYCIYISLSLLNIYIYLYLQVIMYIRYPWTRSCERYPGVDKSYLIMRRTPPGQVPAHQVSVWKQELCLIFFDLLKSMDFYKNLVRHGPLVHHDDIGIH